MELKLYNPKQALNKAYLKEKVSRENIELFKKNLSTLIEKIDEKESEEHLKNVISDFLKDTWYKETNEINTKGRKDLVIHTGKTTKEPVGVILEVKKPSNKPEMISEAKPNAKAMHELILYYLRERIEHNNIDIKYLVVTNIYEWYIFDEVWFEKKVFGNTKLKKDFENWKLSGNDTKFFYESIAKPFLETIDETIECTYFDIRPFEKIISNEDKKDDNKLIALYKILSPVHLLKQPFANDSNSLDTKFYSELLHIIGLEEVKDGGKKLIKRKAKSDVASILENAIMKLEDKDSLRNISNLPSYGSDKTEQLFNVALELCITWINRVLFLKLLEAQLFKYHKGNNDYVFLNHKTIQDFDELSNLFFQVLAEKQSNRREHLKEKFKRVPYLNSSLFERTELERQTFDISGLDNHLELKFIPSTVLKNELGKRKSGGLPTLQYLFDFLDSYDFTSEGSEEIQEQNKNLINASVLGLIFEKINGYKDGSFFTPGFVTMYMCKETIRKAVIQKFNEKYKIDCETFAELKNFVAGRFKPKDVLEFNSVINDLKICDPAVGSGHFLVSALNEVIAIKAELNILADSEGSRLSGYEVKIENDELIITYNDNTEIFEYSVTGNSISKETQKVQKTLFHEKESIIENSLFGVDINPNSVKICRLRLWIELLKNAYYTEESKFSELETLPNIDINIKCGNSLISRFPLDSDLKKALKGKWNIETYKIAVHSYHEAENKEEKRKLEELINTIKKDFRTEINSKDPKVVSLNKLKEQIAFLPTQTKLFDLSTQEKKEFDLKIKKLTGDATKLEIEIEEIKSNKIFENAFEWRFEFPEVLNKDGEFNGFDLVIANPPYIRQEELGTLKTYLKERYDVFVSGGDIFSYFYELGHNILKENGVFGFINNTFDKTTAGKVLREFVSTNFSISQYIDFTSVVVFEDATTYPIILIAEKEKTHKTFQYFKFPKENFHNKSLLNNTELFSVVTQDSLKNAGWNFLDETGAGLLNKITKHKSLLEIYGKCYYGVKTALNEAFVTEKNLGDYDVLKSVYDGKDLKKWVAPNPSKKMIVFESKSTKMEFGELDELAAISKMQIEYPEIFTHLLPFEDAAKNRYDKGEYWWELRSCAYYNLFAKPKIIFPNLQNTNKFAFDESGVYLNAPAVFLPTSDKYLLAVLNSKVVWHFLKSVCVVRSGGFIEVKPQYFEQIPIPGASEKAKQNLIALVEQIISKGLQGKERLTQENKIDELVYKLYNLTEEEIKIVGGFDK